MTLLEQIQLSKNTKSAEKRPYEPHLPRGSYTIFRAKKVRFVQIRISFLENIIKNVRMVDFALPCSSPGLLKVRNKSNSSVKYPIFALKLSIFFMSFLSPTKLLKKK